MELDLLPYEHFSSYCHYTSPAGLFGILKEKCFYLTNAKFLNDPSEVEYAEKILLKAVAKNSEHIHYKDITHKIIEKHVYKQKKEHYTLSLTPDSDSLSMWQYYGSNGYSIRINITKLISNSNIANYAKVLDRDKSISINKIVYYEEEQIRIVDGYLKDVFSNDNYLEEEIDERIQSFLEKYEYSKLFFKNISYQAEKEYRCLFSLEDLDAQEVNNYKLSKNGVVIPYIKISIEKLNEVIEEIRIHPAMNEELSRDGLQRLLKSNKMESTIITKSDIPFRDI